MLLLPWLLEKEPALAALWGYIGIKAEGKVKSGVGTHPSGEGLGDLGYLTGLGKKKSE